MKPEVILEAQLSQLRIIQNPILKIFNTNQVRPGEIVSFSIIPWCYQNAGYIDQGEVKLTGMSPIEGSMPLIQGIPITIEAEWEIFDEHGNLAIEGIDYLLINKKNEPNISLIFIPRVITELTNNASKVITNSNKRYIITSKATVKLGSDYSISKQIPSVTVSIMPLAIPTVFVAFSNPNFSLFTESKNRSNDEDEGETIVIVPPHSQIRTDKDLLQTLEKLDESIFHLYSLHDFNLLHIFLNLLCNVIRSYHNLQFIISSKTDLNDIPCENDNGWSDNISSILFLGAPGSSITCYNNIKKPTDGSFTLSIDITKGACYALVRRLDNAKPETEPYGTELEILNASTHSEGFDDQISFIEFNNLPINPIVIDKFKY